MVELECPGDQAGKSSARAPPPAANLGRVERRRRRKWRVWLRSPVSIPVSLISPGTVESTAPPVPAPWAACGPGIVPLWPPGGRVAILGQGRAFPHTHLEARQRRPWLPPSPPASSRPLSCPRRAGLALACPAAGSASGWSGSCSETPRRDFAPLFPAGRARSVAGGTGTRCSGGPRAEPVLPQREAPTRFLQHLGRVFTSTALVRAVFYVI